MFIFRLFGLFIFIFSLLLTNTAFAKDKKKLTIDDALDIGLNNNLKIKAMKNKAGLYNALLDSSKAIANPTFTLDTNLSQKTYQVGVMQFVETGEKKNLRIKEVNKSKELFDLELKNLSVQIKFELKKKFNELVYLQKQEKQYTDLLTLADEIYQISKKREQAGDIPLFDVLQAELLLTENKTEKEKVSFLLHQEKFNLSDLMGVTLKEDYDFLDKDILYNNKEKTENLLKSSLDNNLDLKQNKSYQEILEIQKNKFKEENVPNFYLASGLDLTLSSPSSFGIFFNTSIDIPIFYKKEGQIKETEEKFNQVFLENKVIEESLKLELFKAQSKISFLEQKKAEYEKSIMPKTLEVLNKAKLSFSAGKSNLLSVITANNTYIKTQLSYIQIVFEYKNAIIDLERITLCN